MREKSTSEIGALMHSGSSSRISETVSPMTLLDMVMLAPNSISTMRTWR